MQNLLISFYWLLLNFTCKITTKIAQNNKISKIFLFFVNAIQYAQGAILVSFDKICIFAR